MRPLPALLPILAAALCGAASSAQAAGFDGKWVAYIPAQGRCKETSVMELLVTGGDVIGTVHNRGGNGHLTGKLEDGGEGAFTVNGAYEGTMKFTGDHFQATWTNNACVRHAEGDRAPDAAQEAALLADRKKHQARYAELLNLARGGGAGLDYSELRAESVYAQNWEFYDARAIALLEQARASVKGKDCAAGMDTLDQALKYDFVMDEAHALKAQCLRAAGRMTEAKTEQDVADGLKASLMQSSAGQHTLLRAVTGRDGAEVNSAYAVATYREEMEILANRDIQLKYRQTEVRGSDGHYYDLVQAISIRNGLGVSIEPKDIYFDVTSFVRGRTSKQAAFDMAKATVAAQ